jgi:hypothetical protein
MKATRRFAKVKKFKFWKTILLLETLGNLKRPFYDGQLRPNLLHLMMMVALISDSFCLLALKVFE